MDYTVEQLATLSAMSVRNIRAHQARLLLHPPQIRGRVGYYDDSHVERLALIAQLQAEGFTLDAIRMILSRGAALSAEVERAGTPGGDTEPLAWLPINDEGLALATSHGEATLTRLLDLGIVRRDGRGEWWVRAGVRPFWRLVGLGVPPGLVIDMILAVAEDALSQLDRVDGCVAGWREHHGSDDEAIPDDAGLVEGQARDLVAAVVAIVMETRPAAPE